jgi:16S rRNA (cytosine967-C5)-methyltransferase
VSDAGASVLALSARALHRIAFEGRSADTALKPGQALSASVQAITLGSLRWFGRLEPILEALLGPTRVTPMVRALLLVGLHQLEYSRNPREATVSTAVDAVRKLGQPRASGLVNALLRRYLREREALCNQALRDEAAIYAHPSWLLRALREAWPSYWQQIAELNNTQAPMALRVNRMRCAVPAYQTLLADAGLTARSLDWASQALVLDRATAVQALPGFADGQVSVQDAGAQLASALLAARPGERVLDACAAPGGKTCAILEAAGGDLALTAIDVDDRRLARVAENLARLRLSARLVCADVREHPEWWDGQPFDRILVDAPCSAVGVIRRHPDIKLLRRATDISQFAATQRRILEQCLKMLRPGGCLLYCTCSLLPDENEGVVGSVLSGAVGGARAVPFPPNDSKGSVVWPPQAQFLAHGVQLLPTDAAPTDGFYYAYLTVT